MKIRKLHGNFSVADQITPADIPEIIGHGFKTIICNRPDNETSDQPTFSEIDFMAEKSGLATEFFPVNSGTMTDEDAVDFANLLDRTATPALAYCRTGSRCIFLWALSQSAKGKPGNQTIEMALNAGCDLSDFSTRIHDLANRFS